MFDDLDEELEQLGFGSAWEDLTMRIRPRITPYHPKKFSTEDARKEARRKTARESARRCRLLKDPAKLKAKNRANYLKRKAKGATKLDYERRKKKLQGSSSAL